MNGEPLETSRGGFGPAPAVRCALLGLILFGLALPLHDLWSHPDRLSRLTSLQVDAQTYHDLGARLAAHGHWTDIPLRQPPGFVVLLALVYRVFGVSYVSAKLLLWVCLAAATALAAWLGRRVWGGDAGWGAALLTATAPALRHYASTVQYELVVATQVLALLALVVRAAAARGCGAILAWTAVGGLAAAALALTREVFVGVIPIVAAWLVWRLTSAAGPRRAGGAGLVFLAVAIGPVAGWSAVQSQRLGQVVLLSDKGPVTFALGNNPRASGTYNGERVVQPAGLQFLRERPGAALSLAGRKVLYFWGVLRDPWNVPRPAGLWWYRATGGLVPLAVSLPLARGGWLLCAALFAVASLVATGRWVQWWLLPAVVGAVCAAHAVTLSSHRFAVPTLPVVFVLIAGPLTAGARAAAGCCGRAVWRGAAAATVATLAVLFQWWGAPPPAIAFAATALDAMNATTVTDAAFGRTVRVVRAAEARRSGLVLADEYLAAGRYQLRVTATRGGPEATVDTPVARVTVMDGDGGIRCREDVSAGLIPRHVLGMFWVPCGLTEDGPATLIVDALGRADLGLAEVAFVRDRGQP